MASIGPALVAADPAEAIKNPPPQAGAANRNQGGMVQGWHDWLTAPENRAMFAQIGINLLQPAAPGQSTAGQFGQAVGAGLEAKDRQTQQNIANQQAQQELDIKQQSAEDLTGVRAAQARNYDALAKGGGKGDNAKTLNVRRYVAAQKALESTQKLIAQQELLADQEDPVQVQELESLRQQAALLQQTVDEAQAAMHADVNVGDRSAGAASGVPAPSATPALGDPMGELVQKAKTALAANPANKAAIIQAATVAAQKAGLVFNPAALDTP